MLLWKPFFIPCTYYFVAFSWLHSIQVILAYEQTMDLYVQIYCNGSGSTASIQALDDGKLYYVLYSMGNYYIENIKGKYTKQLVMIIKISKMYINIRKL